MRALEVKRSTGRSILDFRTQNRKVRPFNIKTIGLRLPRETLIQRIDHRVDRMMEQGLLDEVKALQPQKHLNALQTVGYTELFDHLEGRTTLDEAIENIKVNTRRYAKRQMTWFRKDPSIRWIDAGEGLSKDNLTLILS
jgi:tRNA dimethylallyltransferase